MRIIKSILSVILIMSLVLESSLVALASNQHDSEEMWIQCSKVVSDIETELNCEGSTIRNELVLTIQRLQREHSENMDENGISGFESLICEAETMLDHYDRAVELKKNTDHPSRDEGDEYYYQAATAISAWFGIKGYYLAQELLNHMVNNTTLYSYYYPTYGYRVESSSVFWLYYNSSALAGTGEFTNTGTSVAKDLYYAIHLFDWSKPAGSFVISDIYDFANDKSYWGSIQGVAVATMYIAQSMGLFKPYYVNIIR